MTALPGSDLDRHPVETPTGRTLRLLTEEATAKERERCARIADRIRGTLKNGGAINACKAIAAAIRE